MIEVIVILTFVTIIIINLGIIKGNTDMMNTGIVLFFIMIILGWGILGFLVPINDNENRIKTSVEYHIDTVYVSVDSIQYVFNFDKKIDFDFITDTTTFYLNSCTNMYGALEYEELYYIIKDKKFKSNRRW